MIDFTIQAVESPDLDALSDLSGEPIVERISKVIAGAKAAGVTTGNVMLLDTDLMRRDGALAIASATEAGFSCTVMVDPGDRDTTSLVDRAAAAGARGVKFHPYLLGLSDDRFEAAVAVARRAEIHGMWIAVCCSYGTARVHEVSGVRLVATLVRSGIEAPIIGLHAGGAAVLDLMSVALDAPNVLLETSFSLVFWQGSSVEQDLAFAIRKVGVDRCLHGSDNPFVSFDEAIAALTDFLSRHGFSDEDADRILGGTASERLGL